jgi:mRNA-degrading endonuclease toxin of MazEF toxin-antitoxin module
MVKRIGALSRATMGRINQALRISLGLVGL